MKKRISLGGTTTVDTPSNETNADLKLKLEEFTIKLDSMASMLRLIRKQATKKYKEQSGEEVIEEENLMNKDGIPLNTVYTGITSKSPYPYILIVDGNGDYKIGEKSFDSLSMAAEFVSGVRRSGWTFWKTFDGRTIKEVFKDG